MLRMLIHSAERQMLALACNSGVCEQTLALVQNTAHQDWTQSWT